MKKKRDIRYLLLISLILSAAYLSQANNNVTGSSIEGTQSQESIDSLQAAVKQMEESGNIREQAKLYATIANIYDFRARDKLAMEYHKKSAALYRKAGDQKGLAGELTNIGITYRQMGNYGESMEALLESLSLFRQLNDSVNVVEALLAMGFVFMYVDRWEDALEVQEQAREIYYQLNDSMGIARIFNDMGAVNWAAGNYQQALEQHKEALRIRLNSNEYYYTYASYHYIANIYERLMDFEKALENYKSALKFAERSGTKIAIIGSYNGIGDILFKTGNYKQAMEYYKKAEIASREIEDGTGRAQAYIKIAKIQNIQNNPTGAINSLQLAGKALPNSLFIYLEEIYFEIAKAYEQLGDYRNAFINMELYGNMKDSVTKTENLEKVTELTNRFEFENLLALQRDSQEKTIQLKQAQIDRQKIFRNYILFGMFAILVLATIFYIRYMEKNKLNKKLNQALTDLKATQTQLIHAEKMASLGELTAGVAHEIQNPLNFVNNFSEVNAELITELKEELEAENWKEVKIIAEDISLNEEKIKQHGQRADAIVRGMLQHSRSSNDEPEPTDINKLADEYLRLAFHGMRARDKSFQADYKTEFDESLPKVNIIRQDIGRVFLNLINNAFYAVNERRQTDGSAYEPQVKIKTTLKDKKAEIIIMDNGKGIPEQVAEKIFQPFFTTKPAGKGTGLGLSLSYDIITKGHGGTIEVKSTEGKLTQFIITLPI